MSEVFVPFCEGWIDGDEKAQNDITNLMKIIRFYVWDTPCECVSSCGKSMKERGWGKEVWKDYPLLKPLFLEEAGLSVEKNTWKKVKKKDEMSTGLRICGMSGNGYEKHPQVNKVVFFSDGKAADVLQVLFYIRCALAHGRFSIINSNNVTIYRLEAIKHNCNDKNSLRARMFIQESTLLKWIELLSSKSNYSKIVNDYLKRQEEVILSRIKNAEVRSKEVLKSELNSSNELFEFVFEDLKKNNSIKYDKKEKKWITLN